MDTRTYLSWFFLIIFLQSAAIIAEPLDKIEKLQSASLIYVNANHQAILSKNPQQPLIPASTVKLLTALMAVETWGLNYRFKTEFYYQEDDQVLWIKGLADPLLISEEIDLIVETLSKQGIDEINSIGIDESYFSQDILLEGRSNSNNPYDAPVSALAANFNSISLKIDNGKVTSQEKQTPLTNLAKQLASPLPNGKHRINLGLQEYGSRYFAELLLVKLRSIGVNAGSEIKKGLIPTTASLLFVHNNSHTLEQVITAMLEYSNNFIASQLYLNFGVEKYGAPASTLKSKQAVTEYISKKFKWEDYQLLDGAGLSRKNKISAVQLIDVLKAFGSYVYLMPTQNKNIRAKTGTLTGVSTYAGYIKRDEDWAMFAFMANQPLEYRFREKLAEQLSRY